MTRLYALFLYLGGVCIGLVFTAAGAVGEGVVTITVKLRTWRVGNSLYAETTIGNGRPLVTQYGPISEEQMDELRQQLEAELKAENRRIVQSLYPGAI